jgi:mannonate dehydratase
MAAKIGTHVASTAGDSELLFLRQLGLRHVRVLCTEDQDSEPFLRQTVARFAACGLTIESAVYTPYKAPEIAFGLPGRETTLARIAAFIRTMGRVGIPVLDYDFFLYAPLPATGEAETRGAVAREFDLARTGEFAPVVGTSPSPADMWANYRAMMEALLPAAETAAVRLALHPDDPPVPELLGVPRIFGTMAAYERAMAEFDSPAWGVLFCIGTWAEGGTAMGLGIEEAIRLFAARDKLCTVHFRNVSSPLPLFTETFLDNGYVNMAGVARALLDVGFDGLAIPDHCPTLASDPDGRAALAHSIGYMQALFAR